MPTQKKFLDLDGLIQLLLEIESLDETNIKDMYWSTDNADTYPTIVFKVGDDNGSPHSIKKFTFKGDVTTPAPSNTTTRSITLTIGGTDKTITYYDTTGSAGITYTNATDTGDPTAATNIKAALDRVINKLNSMVGTDEKVKLTAQTGTTALPILTAVSDIPSSGANAEAGYDTDFKFTPSSNTLIVKAATSSASGVTITPSSIKVGTTATNGAAELTPSLLKVGSGTLTSTAYSGKATLTETDLNTVATDKGADMVAYSSSDSVKDALDDIYGQIGSSGGGGNSLTDRLEALEDAVDDLEDNKADITEAVGSITGDSNGNESGSYTMVDGTTTGTFLYKNNKVAQEADTTTDGLIPILLGSGVTPNSVGGKAKYNTLISYNPSSGIFNIRNKNAPSSFIQINGDSISMYKQAGTGSVSISVDGGFSGTSARAISDGNGNNIVNTYATKAALNSLSSKWTGQFHIADTLPPLSNTGDADVDANANLQYLGYIYLIKDEEHGDVNDNVFNEHIVVSEFDESLDRMVWKWELLGTTDAGVDVVSIPATGSNSVASMFAEYVLNA